MTYDFIQPGNKKYYISSGGGLTKCKGCAIVLLVPSNQAKTGEAAELVRGRRKPKSARMVRNREEQGYSGRFLFLTLLFNQFRFKHTDKG